MILIRTFIYFVNRFALLLTGLIVLLSAPCTTKSQQTEVITKCQILAKDFGHSSDSILHRITRETASKLSKLCRNKFPFLAWHAQDEQDTTLRMPALIMSIEGVMENAVDEMKFLTFSKLKSNFDSEKLHLYKNHRTNDTLILFSGRQYELKQDNYLLGKTLNETLDLLFTDDDFLQRLVDQFISNISVSDTLTVWKNTVIVGDSSLILNSSSSDDSQFKVEFRAPMDSLASVVVPGDGEVILNEYTNWPFGGIKCEVFEFRFPAVDKFERAPPHAVTCPPGYLNLLNIYTPGSLQIFIIKYKPSKNDYPDENTQNNSTNGLSRRLSSSTTGDQ